MSNISTDTTMSYDCEKIDVSDIPEVTDFSGWKKNPHAKKIKEDGKYYTRAFDHENGTVTITEIEAETHKIIRSEIVSIAQVMANQEATQ